MILTIPVHLFLRLHTHPHSWVGAPLDIKHHTSHHTLLATRHLESIILEGQDQGHIPLIPVCLVLAA